MGWLYRRAGMGVIALYLGSLYLFYVRMLLYAVRDVFVGGDIDVGFFL
jgi:hypothetical protein